MNITDIRDMFDSIVDEVARSLASQRPAVSSGPYHDPGHASIVGIAAPIYDPLLQPSLRVDIPITESHLVPADVWGYYIEGRILTHSAERIKKNVENLGISRSTGKIDLLTGKVEAK